MAASKAIDARPIGSTISSLPATRPLMVASAFALLGYDIGFRHAVGARNPDYSAVLHFGPSARAGIYPGSGGT
jgi:hypothetical protein